MPNSQQLTQSYKLRNVTFGEIVALLDADPPEDVRLRYQRAQAACALLKGWESASDRIRIARGVPLPGSRRPEPKRQRAKSFQDLPADQPAPKPTP